MQVQRAQIDIEAVSRMRSKVVDMLGELQALIDGQSLHSTSYPLKDLKGSRMYPDAHKAVEGYQAVVMALMDASSVAAETQQTGSMAARLEEVRTASDAAIAALREIGKFFYPEDPEGLGASMPGPVTVVRTIYGFCIQLHNAVTFPESPWLWSLAP